MKKVIRSFLRYINFPAVVALYLVLALMFGCQEDDSDPVPQIVPGIATNVQAEVTQEAIILTWVASQNSDYYYVYRSLQTEDGFQRIATTKELRIVDAGLEVDRTYFYRVSGVRLTEGQKEVEGEKSPTTQAVFVVGILSVEVDLIDFGETSLQQQLTIKNSGSGKLNWAISSDVDWLVFERDSGELQANGEQIITLVSVRPKTPARLEGIISVVSDWDQSFTLPVRMIVPAYPKLSLSTNTLDFGLTREFKMFRIRNSGTGTLEWQVNKLSHADWFTVSPQKGVLLSGQSDTLIIKIVLDQLRKYPLSGRVSENLVFSANDDEERVYVTIKTVNPVLSVSDDSIDMGLNLGVSSFTISNSGSGIVEWEIYGGEDWLTFDPKAGSSEGETDRITVTVDRAHLPPGEHLASLRVDAKDFGQADITVSLEVVDRPQLFVSTPIVVFNSKESEKTFRVQNFGAGILKWQVINDARWLTIKPRSGETGKEIDVVQLLVDRGDLPPGSHTTRVQVEAGVGRQTVNVTMQVPQPVLSLVSEEIDFGTSLKPKNFVLQNSGEGLLYWTAELEEDWVSLVPMKGFLEEGQVVKIALSVDRSQLDARQYRTPIRISSNGGNKTLFVRMKKTGQINGFIRDVKTLKPISQANIKFQSEVEQSKSDGSFGFSYLQEGSYEIIVSSPGFFSRKGLVKTSSGLGEIELFLSPVVRRIGKIRDAARLTSPKRIAYGNRRAYVTNQADDTVAVVNLDTERTVTTIPLKWDQACVPVGVATSSKRSEVYVAASAIDRIKLVDTGVNLDVGEFRVGDYPSECIMGISKLYVSLLREDRVAVVDISIPARTNRIWVGKQPGAMVISPNGKYLYICNYGEATVSVVNLVTEKEIKKINVFNRPDAIAVASSGSYVYVTSQFSGGLSIIDIRQQVEVNRLSIAKSPIGVAAVRFPHDGREVSYVVDRDGMLSGIEMPTQIIIKNISVAASAEVLSYYSETGKFYLIDSLQSTIVILE